MTSQKKIYHKVRIPIWGAIIVLGFMAVMHLGTIFAGNEEGVVSPNQLKLHTLEEVEKAVSEAIIERNTGGLNGSPMYKEGEFAAEGHVMLAAKEDQNTITVYALVSFGFFGFENGVFTTVSGGSRIPTVLVLARASEGKYQLESYKEPIDGGGYLDSVKKLFPKSLHATILSGSDQYIKTVVEQQETQARGYLESIGRDAQVKVGYVEKELSNINVQAANKLTAELTKYNEFLNNCPYWLGTREQLEDGIRYIYEKQQIKAEDGLDVIVFTKYKEDGSIVQQEKYKIVGSEPQLIN